MSSEERGRILRMVAEGKITAEDALGLLDALEPRREEQRVMPMAPPAPPPPQRPTKSLADRTLLIEVHENGKSKVNLRLPFGLARAAGKFIPRRVIQSLNEQGIDLDSILNDAGGVSGTTLVEVHDDENHVLIRVE